MSSTSFAPHESMEIHELLNFKTLTLTKMKMMQGLVFDKDLKALMHKEAQQSLEAVDVLRSLYCRLPMSPVQPPVQPPVQ